MTHCILSPGLLGPCATLLVLFAADTPPQQRPAEATALRQAALGDLSRFVFLAVLEGLYSDGVSNEVVDAIVAREGESGQLQNFVAACPICMPAYDALRTYRGRPAFFGRKDGADTFGPGLPDAVASRLTGKDQQVRLGAIQELIESWVRRRLADLRLTPAEHDAWTWALAQGREKGMQMLLAGLRADKREPIPASTTKRCAFCEGATGACAKR